MKPADHVGRQAERCVVLEQTPLDEVGMITFPRRIGSIDIGAGCLNERSHARTRRSRRLIALRCCGSRLLIRTVTCALLTCRN